MGRHNRTRGGCSVTSWAMVLAFPVMGRKEVGTQCGFNIPVLN